MRILVACEESQAVTKELRKLGHEAYSCDIEPCSGGHPEWHIQADALEIIKIKWDMINATMIAAFLPIDLYRYAVIIINGMNLTSSSPKSWIIARIININGAPFTELFVWNVIPSAAPMKFASISNTNMSINPIITIIMSLGLGILKIFDMSSLNT